MPGRDVRGGPADRRRGRFGRERRAPGDVARAPESIYRALVLGLGDYVRKNGFDDVVIGLSGGIDSAFVAALATERSARMRCGCWRCRRRTRAPRAWRTPSTSAARLGTGSTSLRSRTSSTRTIGAAPLFEGRPEDVAERPSPHPREPADGRVGQVRLARARDREQERVRGRLRHALRRHGGRVRAHQGVPKTLVYELCRWRNTEGPGEPIPERVLTKAPSAELRPDQKDTNSLPPYASLDPIIEG